MLIGELSQRTGVSIRMLRYYEEQGLLLPKRQESRYRIYDETDAQRVGQIRMLNNAGLTLERILSLLPSLLKGQPALRSFTEDAALFRREIAAMDEQIRTLNASRRVLEEYLDKHVSVMT